MKLNKLNETKVLRDPIHGYISVEYSVIWDCINAKEFQRLRRIHQLGGDFQVYPSAEHSRFTHSLGVYEIVRRMVYEVKDLSQRISEEDKVVVMLAGLLHDVGHGPFSHAFEHVTHFDHEEYTRKIILGETQINQCLKKVDESLPEKVISIIRHCHSNDILNQIVSAQLDADRMDYLLRDSYFSATSYGKFDLERILRTLRVAQDKTGKQYLVVKESGIHSIEDYIMARYQMYWQVYYHPVSRSYESIFIKLFERLKQLYRENKNYFETLPLLVPFLEKDEVTTTEHYRLDESSMLHYCSLIEEKEDVIASDLARRLLERDLFDYVDATQENLLKIKTELAKHKLDEQYYLHQEEIKASTYDPYKGQKIFIEMKNGEIMALESASTIVDAITKGQIKHEGTIFYPKLRGEENGSN